MNSASELYFNIGLSSPLAKALRYLSSILEHFDSDSAWYQGAGFLPVVGKERRSPSERNGNAVDQ